jgi:hypothetical protein
MTREELQNVIDYIKREIIVPPQSAQWGANLSKDECFNDGVIETIYRLETLLAHTK